MGRHQIFTPDGVAEAMVDLLLETGEIDLVRLLDPGAGAGALTEAAATRLSGSSAALTAIEIDALLSEHLAELQLPSPGIELSVIHEDFLEYAMRHVWDKRFTHVLMNPPYGKLSSTAERSLRLRKLGLYSPNLYASFLLCAVALLAPNGVLVAILPRSFLSGPHFRGLRKSLSSDGHIDTIVTFETRTGVFKRDDVLQDVIIVRFAKSPSETGKQFRLIYANDDMTRRHEVTVDRSRIVRDDLPGGAYHVPRSTDRASRRAPWEKLPALTLPGVRLSTGPVVDFRVSPPMTGHHSPSRVPVVGVEVFHEGGPKRYALKESLTKAHVWQPGQYVVVKRISPKEQIPRLKALMVNASGPSFQNGVAFENHLHVFHRDGTGLSADECNALITRLRSNDAEEYFIEMSGSTQVNAADLTKIVWPEEA